MMERLLTVREVAESLSLSPWTIWRWVLDGSLPSYKIGRARRVAESDVQRLLSDTRQQHGRPVTRRGRKA
jgi:excisionase family DNA binding protein